ncbi:MAG: CPBP family intramembrane metalloprotease [Anaerolineales bacterium]|nr:CPBP family intramembrane metalloprotease [Anaerolineales bacterium]
MSKQSSTNLTNKTRLPATTRTALAALLPPLVGVAVGAAAQETLVPLLAALGIVSWFLGLAWYGLPALGLRGKRPLFAGIGFAVIAWIPFLLLRFIFVALNPETPIGRGAPAGQAFFYMLLFEAFAVQLWAFGLVFRSLAEWRGGLTAAIGSGVLFGMAAFLLFQESFVDTPSSFLYFLLWGVLYGVIRLRTGSLLGIVVVQALHSFTAWVVLLPTAQPDPGQLQSLYLASSAVYLIVVWRLWPKEKEDYRV